MKAFAGDDLTGRRFQSLTVVGFADFTVQSSRKWRV